MILSATHSIIGLRSRILGFIVKSIDNFLITRQAIGKGVVTTLGQAPCQKGMSVSFTTAAALVHELMEARDKKRLRTLQKDLTMPSC